MKHIKSLLIMLCCIVSTNVAATTFTVDGICYQENSDGTTVSAAYMTSSYDLSSYTLTIPSSVSDGTTTYSVTAIGNSSYNFIKKSVSNLSKVKLKTITTLNLPSTLTKISSPFFNCLSGLTSVQIDGSTDTDGAKYSVVNGILYNAAKDTLVYYPAGKEFTGFSSIESTVKVLGNEAFVCNSNMPDEVIIPKSIIALEAGDYDDDLFLFYGVFAYSNITTVSFEETTQLTSLPKACFARCESLTTITIPTQITSIGANCFQATALDIELPSHITSIGSEAFRDSEIQGDENGKLVMPSSLTSLGTYAFTLCDNIKTVDFSNTTSELTTISLGAFYDSGVVNVILNDYITTIGRIAFASSSITTLNLAETGSNVTTIDCGAFSDCPISSLTLDDNLEVIGAEAFYNNKLTTVNLTSKITDIGCYAFQNNLLAGKIDIPASLDTMGCNVWSKNSGITAFNVEDGNEKFQSLDSIIFSKDGTILYAYPPARENLDYSYQVPYGVTTIRGGAFYGCTMKHITLPSTLTTIENGAFAEADNMTEMTLPLNVSQIIRHGCPSFTNSKHNFEPIFYNSAIESIYVLSETAPTVNKSTYPLSSTNKLYLTGNITSYPNVYVKNSYLSNYTSSSYWKVCTVSSDVPLTMTASGLKSMGRDFDVDLSSTDSVSAYVATGVTTSNGETYITMTPITVDGQTAGKYVPAYDGTETRDGVEYDKFVGVVLKGTAGGSFTYRIGENEDATFNTKSSDNTNYLIAAEVPTKVPNVADGYTNLALKDGLFRYYALASGYTNYNKSYLHLPTTMLQATSAKGFSLMFVENDETTGITNIAKDDATKTEVWYNLQGVRLSGKPSAPGIYVNNGKKVVVE
jgi:hypothetical protein